MSQEAPVLVAIDVGYSKKKPTCGVASTRQEVLSEIGRFAELAGPSGATVYFGKYRLDVLEPALRRLSAGRTLQHAVCVLDGPLGPHGPPRVNRHVDTVCMSGQFKGRAVPASVRGGGRGLVDATYRIAHALIGCDRGAAYRFAAHRDPNVPGPQIFETHPTVGLAVLTPVLPVAEIPNRRRQAKSDFYWEDRLAGHRVEAVIGIQGIAKVSDHEHRAALYALAVAAQISGCAADGSKAIVIGKPEPSYDGGVYVLLGPVHSSWEPAVRQVEAVAWRANSFGGVSPIGLSEIPDVTTPNDGPT